MRSHALESMLRRVEETAHVASGRFPVFADPRSGEWTWVPPPTAGRPASGPECSGWRGRHRPGVSSPTWPSRTPDGCGAGPGRRPCCADSSSGTGRGSRPCWTRRRYGGSELAITAARSLAEGFDPVARLLPPGPEDAERYGWPSPGACVDGVPGAVPLLAFAAAATGDDRLRDIALAHARGHLALCARTDGTVAQSATYDGQGRLLGQATLEGFSRTSTWARAQAWAMLGLAQAAHLDDEFTQPARHVADWYVDHLPADGVCYWDFDDPAIPDAPLDTSATAIAAAALMKLAALGLYRYRVAAEQIVGALAARHLGAHGGLLDGCYNGQTGLATSNELIWGDYYFLEALLGLDDVIKPGTL